MQAKEKIWMEIISSLSDIWPSIEIVVEREELMERVGEAIDDIK